MTSGGPETSGEYRQPTASWKREPAEAPEYFLLRPDAERLYGYSHAVKIGDDVVVENVFTTDMARFLEVASYRTSIYAEQLSTGTWLEVKGLALPELMIEIELEAHRSRQGLASFRHERDVNSGRVRATGCPVIEHLSGGVVYSLGSQPSQQKVQSFSLGIPMASTRSSSRW